VAEERIARRKHIGGFHRALDYCLSAAGVGLDDLDMLVVSTCAEEPLEDGCDLGLPIAREKVRAMPSHHLSHAYSAFLTSPFDEAVVMIFDNEGNIVGGRRSPHYWDNRVERNSYYVGRGTELEPLTAADDRLADDELGPGEIYRHFTYFLGWPSYVYAGKTMGLAPYGRRRILDDVQVFRLEAGQIHSLLLNGRETPPASVTALGHASGVPLGPPRSPGEPLTPRHGEIAALVQDELERALIYKAEELYKLTGIKNLCLGGGVALNCVANRRILDDTPFERLYVCSAPGDTGQCLGNAIYGWTRLAGHGRPAPIRPYLGRRYSRSEIAAAIAAQGDLVTCERSAQVAADAARLLADSHVIAWFQGGSELGPRALGARSILADPRLFAMGDYLNLVVKGREPFRPYGPSVLAEAAERFFDLPQHSPYMELVGTVRPEMRSRIPAVVHIDGTSRVHTVVEGDSPLFARLLTEFERLTGFPLVLNTSFNMGGEPIVESPEDALRCFLRSELDVLIMDEFIVRRASRPASPGFRRWAAAAEPVARPYGGPATGNR